MKSLLTCSAAAVVAAATLISAGREVCGQHMPAMPASPLAGGAAAAGGNSYVDAHGNPIVLPASFNAPCNCPPYGGGGLYGDGSGTAYADFGGYGPDQCGPYYFDISGAAIWLQGVDFFKDVPDLGAVGLLGPTIINLENDNDSYNPGFQIAGRYDLGPLSVFEATYMGLYDIGFNDVRISEDEAARTGQPVLPFSLTSVFSGYGITPIAGLDEGEIYRTNYEADLQTTELSYRRYWLGHNPRVSGTYLLGFRYTRLKESLNFAAEALGGNSTLHWGDTNQLVGFQFGGDGWVCLRQGLRLGLDTKGGIYNNRYKFRNITNVPDPDIDNIDVAVEGNQPAFIGEASLELVADIFPSFSIRGGYSVMAMTSLVTVGNNIVPDQFAVGAGNPAFFDQASVTFHGFRAGLEYIW